MQNYGLSRFLLITLITTLVLATGACSGSGSGADPFNQAGNDGSSAGGDSGDTVSITITSPASGENLETPDGGVTLAGIAASAAPIVSVSWTNDKGGEGTASGSETWETDTIPLQVGSNTITITAEDSTGATASRTILIKRETEGTQSVTLSWAPPTAREDNSPLPDLAGYYIHYGRMSETYDYEIKIENAGVVSYVVENLSSGTWYFSARAYDSNGLISDLSNEISVELP